MFEDKKIDDGAAVLSALFREFKTVELDTPSPYISPSSLNCQVGCAFKLTQAPITPQKESFQSRSYADAGSDRHFRIQQFLSSTSYWVNVADYVAANKLDLIVVEQNGYETLLMSEKYKVRFRCDGMLFIGGKYYILEIKTERQEANSVRTAADEKHLKQGLCYSALLGVNRLLWVYEGRNYLEQKVFMQEVSKLEQDSILSYIQEIVNFKDTPEKLQKDLKGCNSCNYKNYCTMYFREIRNKEIRDGIQARRDASKD